jgi:hypothetical protein
MENKNQLNNDSAFYWSVCVLRRLRDMGLLSQRNMKKSVISARNTMAQSYIVSEKITFQKM